MGVLADAAPGNWSHVAWYGPSGEPSCSSGDPALGVDLGGILPVTCAPPPETQAALPGEITVVTDRSVYDLPV